MPHKRGVELSINTMILMGLGLAIFLILGYLLLTNSGKTTQTLTDIQQPLELQRCLTQGKITSGRGDYDNDGLPDSCDPCLGGRDADKQGKIFDEDNDGIPTACDNNDDALTGKDRTTPQKACTEKKGAWIIQRCQLPTYTKR